MDSEIHGERLPAVGPIQETPEAQPGLETPIGERTQALRALAVGDIAWLEEHHPAVAHRFTERNEEARIAREAMIDRIESKNR